MNASTPFDAGARCDTCGKFGVYAFSDQRLCLECYQERGSCCAESTCAMEAKDESTPARDSDT